MIPQHPDWSALTEPKPLLTYKGLPRAEPMAPNQAVSVGPSGLNDSAGKLDKRFWFSYQSNGKIYIRGSL